MYLVPAHQESPLPTQPLPVTTTTTTQETRPSVKTKRVAKNNVKHHSHDKWVALLTKMLEVDIKETELRRRFADFLRYVLPQFTPQTARHVHPKIATAICSNQTIEASIHG
jgi:hypothetical protein